MVQRRCKVFLISFLECDSAWWEIKSKFLQANWSYRGAIVPCAWPFQRECVIGAWGPSLASAAIVLLYKTNLTVTSRSPWIHSLLPWNLKQQRRHRHHQPSPILVQPNWWPLQCLSQNKKNSTFTGNNFLVLVVLPGVTSSALWFISRGAGMHRWLCFVVISHPDFHWGSKMSACLRCLFQLSRSLMSYSLSVFLPLI